MNEVERRKANWRRLEEQVRAEVDGARHEAVQAIAEAGRLDYDDPNYSSKVGPLLDAAVAGFERHRTLVNMVLPEVEKQSRAATSFNPGDVLPWQQMAERGSGERRAATVPDCRPGSGELGAHPGVRLVSGPGEENRSAGGCPAGNRPHGRHQEGKQENG